MNVRLNLRHVMLGMLALTVVLVGIALLNDGSDGGERSPLGRVLGPQPSATNPAAPSTTVGPLRPQVEHDLATVLLAKLSPGYEPADATRFLQGPLDATAASHLEPDPVAERRRLDAGGFQRGYQRVWTTASGDVVGAVVYQFGDEGGADGYLTEGTSVVLRQGADEFAVPVDRARGFTQSDGSMTVHTVAFARGPYFFLFFAGGERPDLTTEPAVTAALAQVSLLAAHG